MDEECKSGEEILFCAHVLLNNVTQPPYFYLGYTCNLYSKYDGIYKDPKYPKGYRIVRKVKGTKILTEINDTGNPEDSKFIRGKSGSLFSIPTTAFTFYEFSGTEAAPPKKPEDIVSAALSALPKGEDAQDTTVVGQFSLQDNNSAFPYGTITFPDKTVWTRI